MGAVEYSSGLVTGVYARSLLDYLRSRGVDPVRLYGTQVVAKLESPAQPQQMLLAEWASMFDAAASTLADPDLALKAGAKVQARHLGLLARVLMSCKTLKDMFEQLIRYIRLLGEMGQPRLEIQDTHSTLYWTWPFKTPAPPALVQYMQATRVTFVRWALNNPDFKPEVYFHFAEPADLSTYKLIFDAPLHFGQSESKLVFPTEFLAYPVVSADESLLKSAEAEAQIVIKQLAGETKLQQQIEASLVGQLETGQATLEAVAESLNLSPRVLQRRLKSENTSFREILERVRQTRAENYLRDPDLSLAEVAFLLGYTEQSVLQYAFKQWTGMTPGMFREKENVLLKNKVSRI